MSRAAVLLLAALAASCGGAKEPDEVRVFAASSLTEVMQTIAADFEKETGTKVKLNLAASSTLAKQIVEGAPCDVFLSADEEWADFVDDAGLVGSRRDLLTNSLVLVMGRDDPRCSGPHEEGESRVDRIRKRLEETTGRIAMGDPTHVPAGRYARRALEGAGLWTVVEKRIVPCESVRAALALAERGEVEQAIVYSTDAGASRAVWYPQRFPDVPGVRIAYPVMEVGPWTKSGYRFDQYLGGPAARRVFEAAGFGVEGQTE